MHRRCPTSMEHALYHSQEQKLHRGFSQSCGINKLVLTYSEAFLVETIWRKQFYISKPLQPECSVIMYFALVMWLNYTSSGTRSSGWYKYNWQEDIEQRNQSEWCDMWYPQTMFHLFILSPYPLAQTKN